MEIRIYSRRWGHDDVYYIQKTPSGWSIRYLTDDGNCNSKGEPALFEALDHDSINYPEELGGYFDFLWRRADSEGWNDDMIQPKLEILAEWINRTEQSSPSDPFFVQFK